MCQSPILTPESPVCFRPPDHEPQPLAPRAQRRPGLGCLLFGLLLSVAAGGCGAPERAPSISDDAEAAAPRALAAVRSRDLPLEVRVLGARQVAAATLQLELEIVRADAAAANGAATVSPEAMQAAVSGLAGLSILTADGRRRLFPLRGDASPAAPAVPGPGGSERLRVLFASDPPVAGPVTVLLPGFAPIAGVPVS